MKPRSLLVVANPWIHIDRHGRPAGACPYDMPPGQQSFIGASVCRKRTRILAKGIEGRQDHVQDTCWNFTADPQTVPDTPYYRKRLISGDILPADAATARAAMHKTFTEPSKALEAARAKAIGAFDAERGAGAFAALEAERKASLAAEDQPPKTPDGDTPPADSTDADETATKSRTGKKGNS